MSESYLPNDRARWEPAVHAGGESIGDGDAVAECGDRVFTLPDLAPEDFSVYCPQHGHIDWFDVTFLTEKYPGESNS